MLTESELKELVDLLGRFTEDQEVVEESGDLQELDEAAGQVIGIEESADNDVKLTLPITFLPVVQDSINNKRNKQNMNG